MWGLDSQRRTSRRFQVLGYYASTRAALKRDTKPATQPKREGFRKSPAKQERDQKRLAEYEEEKREEDTKVHEFLSSEKNFLEATAFRDQLQSKGEVVSTMSCAGLSVEVADVLRDRKLRYTHPSLVKYGFM